MIREVDLACHGCAFCGMRKERIKDNCKLEYIRIHASATAVTRPRTRLGDGLCSGCTSAMATPLGLALPCFVCARGTVGYSDCDTAGSGAAYENTDTHALECQSVPVPPPTRPHVAGTPSTGRRDRFFSCAGRIELAAATCIRLCLPPSKRTAPTRSVRAYNHTVSSVHLLSCSRLVSLKSLGRKSRIFE